MTRGYKDILSPVLIALCVAALSTAAYFARPQVLEQLELLTYDLRMVARGERADSGRVVVIAVDEESIRRVGRWPWSRATMAKLVTALGESGVKGAVYDIGFFDPEPKPAQEELLSLVKNAGALGLQPTPQLRGYLKQRLAVTNPDALLAQAFAKSPVPQVLGFYMQFARNRVDVTGSTENMLGYPLQKQLPGSRMPERLPVPSAKAARANISLLAKTANGQASFNVFPDPDGTVRRYQLVFDLNGKTVMPLAAALFSRAVPDAPPALVLGGAGIAGVEWGQHVIRTDARGSMLLNYRGAGGSIPHVPAWRLLEGQEVAPMLSNRYAIVGVTAPAVFDMRTTPYEVTYPGVEIHATALDNMLSQDYIIRPSWAPVADLGMLWLVCGLCVLFFVRSRPVFSLAGCLALAIAAFTGNQYLLEHKLFWLNLTYPLVALTATFLLLNVYRFMFADKEKKQVKAAFNKYLDPNVVHQVMENPDELRLGGAQRELTVLFSDIVGFTSFAERISPEELVVVLNRYLTAMTDVILHHRGLLDKYVGDAVMAVFGAPLHYDDHAEEACRAAMAMRTVLGELNKELVKEGYQPIEMGVGIHTGDMVAGNMGSTQRLSYTVVGDAVNLASRLEGLTRRYGCRVLISEAVQSAAGGSFWTRPVDLVRVKGREEPVEVYELLAPIEQPNPVPYMENYLAMLDEYRAGNLAAALSAAAELAARYPEDTVLQYYAEQTRKLAENPPEEWDSVCTLNEK